MRIGHGYDAHTFVSNRPLILGGINIPFEYGLAAHSDGDAVIHALCDALLGAAALGDIGRHFPDTSSEFENIDSRVLLRHVAGLLQNHGYSLVNADITILAQQPKMAPHIEEMRINLAADLQTEPPSINIKATTTEGMGFIGRSEGIVVYAVALLE
ncbi:MAG: 2-C-methyl-D-erythritol 2,4-cyclodiphosphate synthase [Gammaproteobacteria bacterium]|nr:2-C-methyl-D-erythritol 2,4-cyclodiphosphate synthase [Gammaproteobacteria bacterium]